MSFISTKKILGERSALLELLCVQFTRFLHSDDSDFEFFRCLFSLLAGSNDVGSVNDAVHFTR